MNLEDRAASPGTPATRGDLGGEASPPAAAPSRRGSRKRRSGVPPLAAVLLALAIAALIAFAAAPIYRSPQLAVVTAVAAVSGMGVAWATQRWRLGGWGIAAALLSLVLLVLPAAVPGLVTGGVPHALRAWGDALAAILLGWKQILTLTLPVGSYQQVLVPVGVTVFVAVGASVLLALRSRTTAVYAALPALAAPVFGTLLGPAVVSPALQLGPLTITAPREQLVWGLTACIAIAWIAWTTGAKRRAALRLGQGAATRSRRVGRGVLAAGMCSVALIAGAVFAPAIPASSRAVPRDTVAPEQVIRAESSPLAGYRAWKRDAAFTEPLFTVAPAGESELPSRLRLAVLDQTNGVDYTARADGGTFTRYPSGGEVTDPTRVRVTIEPGYRGIWVPLTAELGAPPAFGGPHAADLADGFYRNADTGAAIAVPTSAGLRAGDSFTAVLNAAPDAELGEAPARPDGGLSAGASTSDAAESLPDMPELERWLAHQKLPATGTGLQQAIERLRERGYLSHALSDQSDRAWLEALAAEQGTRFVPSAGGHSVARVEELFGELNAQQDAVGASTDQAALVGAVGDDEQFAAAAALLAETMGFDARVVLGVRLGADAGVPGVPSCGESCAGEHMAAWIEARGADGVWAPLDVTPQARIAPASVDTGERLPEHATVPEDRDASESDPELSAGGGDAAAPHTSTPGSEATFWPALRWTLWGVAALALAAVLVLFVLALKALRRRRRAGATDPEVRALGAWEELLDLHADAAPLRPARAASGRQRARAQESLSRTEQAAHIPGGAELARAVDRAVYAPEQVSPAYADELWAAVRAERARLRAESGAWARLRAACSFASLLPRSARDTPNPKNSGGDHG